MFKLHLKRTLFFGLLGLVVALAVAYFSPKVYEGRTGLIVGEEQIPSGYQSLSAEVTSILRAGQARNVETELGVLASEGVFIQALDKYKNSVGGKDLTKDWQKYYLMYNVTGTERSGVAKISVKTYDPESAAKIANKISEVYDAMSLDRAKTSSSRAIEYLEAQRLQSESDLKKAEDDYKKVKSEIGSADPALSL